MPALGLHRTLRSVKLAQRAASKIGFACGGVNRILSKQRRHVEREQAMG